MSKNKTKNTRENKKRLSKIIYFDDGSVTDYIQMIEGGNLVKTTELLNADKGNANVGTSADASVGIGGIFKSLIGFSANAQVKSNLEASTQSESLVKTILQNTILTDFLDVANAENSRIAVFNNITIKVIQDSLGYIIMVSPYMKMLKGNELIVNSELSLDMVKMDDSIRLAKGYFEFEGVKDGKSLILRFNINSFRNNYKISDLLKMDLTIYAVPVGKIDKKNISIVAEINASTSTTTNMQYDNPKYGENPNPADVKNEDVLTVYDVLLAGVEENE